MSVSVQDNAGATQPFGQEVPPSDQNGFVYYVRAFFVRIFTIIGSICSMVGKIFLSLIPKRKTEPVFVPFPRVEETRKYQNASRIARVSIPDDVLVDLLTNITRPLTPFQQKYLGKARKYIRNTPICNIEICHAEIKDICMEPLKNNPYPPEYDNPEFDCSQYDCPWTIIPTVLGIMTIYPIRANTISPDSQTPLHHKIYETQTDLTILNEISDLRRHGMSIPCQLSIGNKKEEECHNYPSCVFLTRNGVHPQKKQTSRVLADIMSVFFQQVYNSGAKKVYIAIEIGDYDPELSNEDKEQIFTQAIQGIMLYLLHFAQTKRIELIMEQIIFLTFPHNDPVLYSDESLRSSMACIKPFLTAESPIFENN